MDSGQTDPTEMLVTYAELPNVMPALHNGGPSKETSWIENYCEFSAPDKEK